MSIFGENDSRCLTNFLHISRTYNQISYRNIWFAKVTITLIMMAQLLFFDIFSKKDLHFNAVEIPEEIQAGEFEDIRFWKHPWNFQVCHSSLGNFRQIWRFTPGNTQLLGILNHCYKQAFFSYFHSSKVFFLISFHIYLLKICYLP